MSELGSDVMTRVVKLLTSEVGDDLLRTVDPHFSWHKADKNYDYTYSGIHTLIYPTDSLFFWGGGDVIEVTEDNFPLLAEAYNEILPSYLVAGITDDQLWAKDKDVCAAAYKQHLDMCDGADVDEHGNHKAYKRPPYPKTTQKSYALMIGDLFAAKVKGMRPQGAAYTYIPTDAWDLFDACGPERQTGMGNPYKPGEYRSKANA